LAGSNAVDPPPTHAARAGTEPAVIARNFERESCTTNQS
jgi:hypothetical protein